MNKKSHVENLNHITQILQERVELYSKRQLEIKRTVKALSRTKTIPSNRILYLMLDAHINYIVNVLGIKSIEKILRTNDMSDLNINTFFSHNSLVFNIFQNLLMKSNVPLKVISEQMVQSLFNVVFSYSENIQRYNVMIYLKQHSDILINEIFKQIAILDKNYIKEVVVRFEKYCENYL